jgi:hypothetical protein
MSESVLGLIKILNGFKESQVFALFIDALNSRTNPSALEASRRSSLSTSLYCLSTIFLISDPRLPFLTLSLRSFDKWNCQPSLKSIRIVFRF